MNQMVLDLLLEGTDFKLTTLSALISPYLTKFMKHNKSSTTFMHDSVIIFSPIHLSVAISINVISSFNLMTEL